MISKWFFYRGNKSWEERSPPKGRRGKRQRSEEKSPNLKVKTPKLSNIDADKSKMGNLTPEYMRPSTAASASTAPTVSSKIKTSTPGHST